MQLLKRVQTRLYITMIVVASLEGETTNGVIKAGRYNQRKD